LLLFGFSGSIEAQNSIAVFNGKGDAYNWTDSLNWEQRKVPNPEKQSISIPEGFSVFYNSSISADFKDSSIFQIRGIIDFGTAHLHMRGFSSLEIHNTAKFIGNEIKLDQNARGIISPKATVKLKELETKGNANLTIHTKCVEISQELKNKDKASIGGEGCFDFTGSHFINTGEGGIFNCRSETYKECESKHIKPPKITGFEGKVVNNEIILNWTSLKEPKNGYYEILKSTDKSEYKFIKFVEGKGSNTYTEGFYPMISSVFYIKLNFLSVSGIPLASKELSLLYAPSKEKDKLSIFPNPTKNLISIKNLKLNENYHLNLYTPEGVLLMNTSLNLQNNSISIEGLKQGNYYVELIDSKGVSTVLRFVKSD
jgi:hypothetical protein